MTAKQQNNLNASLSAKRACVCHTQSATVGIHGWISKGLRSRGLTR